MPNTWRRIANGEGWRTRRGQPARLVALGTMGLILALTSDVAAQGTEYVYLIDASGSMEGRPLGSGNDSIFPRVKEQLTDQFRSLDSGDIVHIYTFHEGIQSHDSFPIESAADRNRAEQHVLGLEARGQSTWVYQSILNAARERMDSFHGVQEYTIYWVYTDGLDNDPRGTDMRRMLEQFAEITQRSAFLFYVTLGVDLPQDDKDEFHTYPEYKHLLFPPGELPRISLLEVRPPRLDFGFVEGDLSNPRSFVLRLDRAVTSSVTLRFRSSFPEVEALGGVVDVEPPTTDFRHRPEVQLRLVNRESFPDATFEGSISVSTDQPLIQVVPDVMTATFSTVPVPTATVTMDAIDLDFGEVAVGALRPEALSLRIELGSSARFGQSGFYVEVDSSERGTAVPSVAWNGTPVADRNQFLTSTDRINELVVSWPETPANPGTRTGRVRLMPENLSLEGNPAWIRGDDGSFTFPWRLQVRPAPIPGWLRLVMVILAVGALVALVVLVWWLRQPNLSGQLIYEPRGRNAEYVRLAGRRPISIGATTAHLPDLPDLVVVSPGRPSATATTTGNVSHMPNGTRDSRPLEGQTLDDGDTLIFSNQHEVTFWSS